MIALGTFIFLSLLSIRATTTSRGRRSSQVPNSAFELPDLFNLKSFNNPSPLSFPASKSPLVSFEDPLRLGDLSRNLMDQSHLHKKLHDLTTSPNIQSAPTFDIFKAQDPGIKSAPKQPFIFHIAQDFFTAAVNFLFQFMI